MTTREPGVVSMWVSPGHPESYEVRVPLDPEASGYAQRVKETLQELQAFEQRSQLRIFLDIYDWNCDALRVGFKIRSSMEYPLLEGQIETLENSRQILSAVASSVVDPQPWFGRRQPREAAEYVAAMEASPFEEPLSIRILARFEPGLFSDDEGNFVPFVRRVSLRLRDAFDLLGPLLNGTERRPGADWFTIALQHGLSANVTESLSRLLLLPQGHGASLEISLRLAASRAVTGRALSVWHFHRADLPALREMGERLKSFGAGSDERIVFLVGEIRMGKRSKVITGTALIEDEARRIEMAVDDELIKIAEFAKSKNSAIQCLGRLRRRPDSGRYEVLQPHDMQVVHGDDAAVKVLRRKLPKSDTGNSQLPFLKGE